MPEIKSSSGKLLENIIHMAEDIVARSIIETIQNSSGVGRAKSYWFKYHPILNNVIIKDNGEGVPPEHYEAFFGIQDLKIHKDKKEKSKYGWGHKVILGLSKKRIVIVEARHKSGTHFHEIWWKDSETNKVMHEQYSTSFLKLGFDRWDDLLKRCGEKPLKDTGVLIYIPDIDPNLRYKISNEHFLRETVLRSWITLIRRGFNIFINDFPVDTPEIDYIFHEPIKINTRFGLIIGEITFSKSDLPKNIPKDKISVVINEYVAYETMFGLPIPQELKGHITGTFYMDFIEEMNIKTAAEHKIDTSNAKWEDLCSQIRPHIHKIISEWTPKVRNLLSPRVRERLKKRNRALNNCWRKLVHESPNKKYWENINLGLNPSGLVPGRKKEKRDKTDKKKEPPIPKDMCPFCGEKFTDLEKHKPYCKNNPNRISRIRSPKKTKPKDYSAKIQYTYYTDSSNPEWISRICNDVIQINRANPIFKIAERRHMAPYHDVYAVGTAIISCNPPVTDDIRELPGRTTELLDEFIMYWWDELERTE